VRREKRGAVNSPSNPSIDAADYTVWRDALTASTSLLEDLTPTSVDETDFDYWRDHFSETLGSGGAGSSSTATVPEPATLEVFLTASPAILSC
jgi:hypothetical protein